MGSLFRAEEMSMVTLFIQFDAAHDTIEELGDLGFVQFVDQNPDINAFQRNFVNEVKRCDEMERKLRFLHDQLTREKASEPFIEEYDMLEGSSSTANLTLDFLETTLEQQEAELLDANQNTEMLERNRNELVELKHVLDKDTVFFQEAGEIAAAVDQGGREEAPLLDHADYQDEEAFYAKTPNNLGFVSGVVDSDRFLSFERVLWRATRGNLYMKHAELDEPIQDPQNDKLLEKYVFIIFFQGQRVETKIRKICEAFGANLYPCPEDPQERRNLLAEVDTRLNDLSLVLSRGKAHRREVLKRISRDLPIWWSKVHKEKAIFNTMNLLDYDHGRKCLIATGWCPRARTPDIQLALRRGTERSGAAVPSILSVDPTEEKPPTYFKTNKLTSVFQEMVDAYGVPRYGEINPAPFSLATFPFLFSVMFGDVGHGILMLLIILPVVLFEKRIAKIKNLNEILRMGFAARYLLLMMSICAIYTGFLYNEFFAIPMKIFDSGFLLDAPGICAPTAAGLPSYVCPQLDGYSYPFGVDWAWMTAQNELLYTNSLKMKMSVIIGVAHMSVGIFMHLLNSLHAKKLIFMLCLFGYMDFLIFYKWNIDYRDLPVIAADQCADIAGKTAPAPQLITTMISMALPMFNPLTCSMSYGLLGGSQQILQYILIITAVVCIPTMLLVKPLLLKRDAKRGIVDAEHGDHFEFGEVFVHQLIHSIEFILGTISNTASYLRLWALSLAHSELSVVFWEKVLLIGIDASKSSTILGVIMLWVTWGVFAGITLGVLIVMESLSAFLHALRLHWVEFQNKFFHGDGKPFVPFSFAELEEIDAFDKE